MDDYGKKEPTVGRSGTSLAARNRLRHADSLLLAAFLGSIAVVLIDFRTRERLLEAESRRPLTQPIPQLLPPPEPPPAATPPAPPPPDFPARETPPVEVRSGGRGAGLADADRSAAYVGPAAPEFTGSPAPADSGLVDAVLFEHPVRGLHPELLRRLRQVEASHRTASPGVEMIVAYRKGSRAHERGLAVDINYFANPYLMHESGEEPQDARLAPVYHRIARLMLGRDSVIPEEITSGTPSPERTLRLYRALHAESRAMIAYFRLMQNRTALERFRARRAPVPGTETLQRQMAQDYVTLSGRAGPAVPGLVYPAPETAGGDPPFAGNPAYRAPEFGFLDLREELVRALTEAGLRWGGTDMSTNSGDVMHFYLPDSELP